MIRWITVLIFFISTVHATQVEDRSLADLVADADHVVIGKVETVKMYGWFGIPYPNPSARTGPGSSNELRWCISVQKSGVLYSKKKDFPAEFVIKLWRKWHMDLEGARSHEGKTYILLLKGDDLQWVYPAFFYRDLSEIEEIKVLIKKKKEPNQALQTMTTAVTDCAAHTPRQLRSCLI
jgi:hypothetical protein